MNAHGDRDESRGEPPFTAAQRRQALREFVTLLGQALFLGAKLAGLLLLAFVGFLVFLGFLVGVF